VTDEFFRKICFLSLIPTLSFFFFSFFRIFLFFILIALLLISVTAALKTGELHFLMQFRTEFCRQIKRDLPKTLFSFHRKKYLGR
jgi:hypothetical protein